MSSGWLVDSGGDGRRKWRQISNRRPRRRGGTSARTSHSMDSTTGCHQVDFSKFHFQLGSICTRINSNFVFSLHRHDHYSETVLGDCHPVQLRVLGENPARDISQLATASSKWDCSAFNILIQTLCPHQLSPYQHSPCQRLTSPTRPSPFARATSMTLESTSGEEKA